MILPTRRTRWDADLTPIEIVRQFFPEASDEEAERLLWERTGWPAFWPKRYPAEPTAHVLTRQVAAFYGALWIHSGRPLCDHCNRPATRDDGLCRRCRSIIVRVGRTAR